MASVNFTGTSRGNQIGNNYGTAEFHQFVKNRLKETKDKLLRQSFQWILRDPQYHSWRNGIDVCLLWIKGGAGKGKTMISIGLIEELSRVQYGPAVLTYFFCQNADNELNTLESLIKGLILRLVNQQIELKEILRHRWDTKNDCFTEDLTLWRTLWNILVEMLDRCNSPKVYIIADGLDECQDSGMADFLKLLIRNGLDHPAKIKWLVTSRPLEAAERVLLAGYDQIQVSLELNSRHVAQAVQSHISHKVDELSIYNKYGETLRREIEDELTTKAEGTFLWVSLGEPNDVHQCMRLLQAMVLAYQRLKVEEIPSVTGLSDEKGAIEALVHRCASFLRMRENNIEFVHQSARDYISGENNQSLIDLHGPLGHYEIMLSCLSYLSQWLKVNLIDMMRPDSTRETSRTLKEGKGRILLARMEYAATYWVYHLENTKQATIVQSETVEKGAVTTFLRTKMLEWLECLSLLHRLPQAIEALNALTRTIKHDHVASALVKHATRFLQQHYHTLDHWPLQIYSSAIIFSPQSTSGSSDRTVKLWDATTGELQSTLSSHSSSVITVVFSPGGEYIASGSYDETIKLWDPMTGGLKKTLVGHKDWVNTLAFSPDGCYA
ncbi:G-protein beta WD- 40 repeats containing protein [Penicillium malachiteum]|uniref:G-protein beta WD- 40 repeats containing protein n=1 Tax=Penicillium malachiteum TaxID=1324776 RepID=A0AAD6HY97_9EURO|nr:G-protein beta WD- 40 repeats containing protein [Penicillium malachiteum]